MIVSAPHSFATAEAAAFAEQLGAARDMALVSDVLERCAEDPQPSVTVGSRALVAAEVVAGALGAPSPWLPPMLADWLAEAPPSIDVATRGVAYRAVASVFSDDSELCGFGFRDVGSAWGDAVTDLRQRLEA